MFIDINDKLDNLTVRTLINGSAGDKSKETLDRKVAEFRRNENWHLYGWIENDEILGVCGVVVHLDYVEIYNIAVDPNVRKHGIGKAMISAIQEKYKTTVKAETDDGAVEFYQRCGFEAEAFMKTYDSGEYKRYRCILHTK